MDWNTALNFYTLDQRARNHSARTIENRVQLMRRIARVTGTPTPLDVEPDDLLRFVGRGIAASSMQRERADLQSFFGWLHAEGYRDDDPAAKLPRVRVPRGRPRPFTVEQIQRMLTSGAYRRTRVMILLGYLMGMRVHEIAKVRTEDYDPDTRMLRVVGKGGKTRHLPVPEVVIAEMKHLPAAGYWFPAGRSNPTGHVRWRSVSDVLRRARDRAGITDERRTAHSLRHTFATQMLWAGADIRSVQELLGHASLSSTQIYTQVTDAQLTHAVSLLPPVQLPERAARRAA